MSEEPRMHPERKWQVLAGAVVAITAVFVFTYATTDRGIVASAIPTLSDNFTDTNQTRAELLKIIESQRLAVYSSYPLEWAFCEHRLDGEIVAADRSDVRVQGQLITSAITCENKAGVRTTYDLSLNQFTGEYKESLRLPSA